MRVQCTCEHMRCVWRVCGAHEVHMQDACLAFAGGMRYMCSVLVKHMQCMCSGHAVNICLSSEMHAMHVQCACSAHAVCMWCTCDEHVMCMRCTCRAVRMTIPIDWYGISWDINKMLESYFVLRSQLESVLSCKAMDVPKHWFRIHIST